MKKLILLSVTVMLFSNCTVMNTISSVANGPVTPHRDLAVSNIGCTREGANVRLEFQLTNHGIGIKQYQLGDAAGIKAVDDLGNPYPGSLVEMQYGIANYGPYARYDLPTGVPVKVIAVFSNVDPRATVFAGIETTGTAYGFETFKPNGTFTFRHIPIVQ